MNRLARTRFGPFSIGKVRAGGVSRLEIPEVFLRRLEEGTAGSMPGAGGGGSGKNRVGPGPGAPRKQGGGGWTNRDDREEKKKKQQLRKRATALKTKEGNTLRSRMLRTR